VLAVHSWPSPARAEQLLKLPPELFTAGSSASRPEHWTTVSTEGLRRLFLVDFTSAEFGSYLVYDRRSDTLYTPPASDESLAMIVASTASASRQRSGSRSSSVFTARHAARCTMFGGADWG